MVSVATCSRCHGDVWQHSLCARPPSSQFAGPFSGAPVPGCAGDVRPDSAVHRRTPLLGSGGGFMGIIIVTTLSGQLGAGIAQWLERRTRD